MKKILYLSLMVTLGLALAGCESTLSLNDQTNLTTESSSVFTLDDLSNYTGADGTTAYIAIDGVIYDVTNVFSNGQHKGMQLGGTDATTVFASSPHSADLLASLLVVGTLEGTE